MARRVTDDSNWHATDPKYDVSPLVADTLAPSAPTMVRMETLRRATVYASDYGCFVESSRQAAMIRE
ncbi:MAG: hypothetical protein LAO77_26150 [Acidobacteriia bacterium]|nr:hypothetical protein [Terriglobia bacterium]